MIFISPLSVPVGKKNFSLNLNIYRNAHHRTLSQAKINYKSLMSSQLQPRQKLDKISITYTLYPKIKRKMDISNVCSVTDKFFSDCLVEMGWLVDDNYLFLDRVVYVFGEVDKHNPRVEIEVIECK